MRRRKEAMNHCLDCSKNICSKCKKVHLQFAELAAHTIKSLEDIRQGKVSQQNTKKIQHPKCPSHEGEMARFFCTTCEMLICRDCTVIDHCKPQHAYIDRNLATPTYKKSLAEFFSPLEQTLKELKESQSTVSRMKQNLGITVDRIRKEVQDRAAEVRAQVRAEITAQENCLLDDIKSIQSDRDQKLDQCEKTLNLLSERIQYSLETARDVTWTASDSNFLSLYPTINKDLKLLVGQNIPRVDNRLSILKFEKSEGVGHIDLGKVRTEGKWELCCEFGKKGSGPGELFFAYDIATLQPDEIAVADYTERRVMIYSMDGIYKSKLSTKGRPCGIAASHTNNYLIVVSQDEANVEVFNKDNTLAFQFPTVPSSEVGKTDVKPWSVAVKNDGTIIVGGIKRMVLTEHSPTDGSLLRTISVRIKPYFLAVDSNDRILISHYQSGVVDITDSNGTTIFTIKPTIQGTAVKYCIGVCTDSSGIYVAVHNTDYNGHIHHYDTQGVFLSCITQGLYWPLGITFTAGGQLAVADNVSGKLYHMV